MRRMALVLIAVACGAPPEPRSPPRVVSTSPAGAVAPDAVSVEIAFTEPLDARGIEDGRFFALCRREDLRDVLRAAESEPGVASGSPVVPARAMLADGGRRAVLRPAGALDPGRPWAAVLSYRARSADGRPIVDADGKARSVAVLFETGAAVDRAPPTPRWVLPPHGPVPANVAQLQIGFDEPVTGEATLPGGGARSTALAADLLGIDVAAPLAPGPLAADVADVRDGAGNPSAPLEPLSVSRCAAETAPELSDVRSTPATLGFTVEASLRGMGRLVAEVAARAGDPACGAVPPPPGSLVTVGEVRPCPGWDPCAPRAVSCSAAVEVHGLCPGQPLVVRVAPEDLARHRGPGTAIEATALRGEPRPVVTEVLADADAPEAAGEYVEIANVGTAALDLAGFSLAKRTPAGKQVRCTIAPGEAAVAPGAHALVVGGSYDGRYALPPGTVIHRCGAGALAGGLPNDRPVAVALEDPAGGVASTAGVVEIPERCAAGALERVHPTGPDVAANWACPGSRSPGACNRSTPPEECPRRPW